MADNNGEKSGGEEVISLEDLVSDASTAPTSTAEPEPVPAESPAAAKPAPANGPPDLSNLDNLLAGEDPEFAKNMESLKAEGQAADVDIDSLDVQDALQGQEGGKGFKGKLRRFWQRARIALAYLRAKLSFLRDGWQAVVGFIRYLAKEGIKNFIQAVIAKLKAMVAALGNAIKAFKGFSRTQKLMLLVVVLCAVASVTIILKTFSGQLLPRWQYSIHRGFAEVADHSFEYDPHEGMEAFNDPLRNPDYVVEISRLIVNIRRGEESGSNPMGFFEFYVEAATQEAAIEIGDRMQEVREVAQKLLTAMNYDDLSSPAGKEKFKMLFRRDLNEFLTKGRVRRVMFKSVVLKP